MLLAVSFCFVLSMLCFFPRKEGEAVGGVGDGKGVFCHIYFVTRYRLVGLVVKASASRAGGPGFESRLRRDFFGVESYQ